ncbi:MAG: hypothetical protein ACR2MP_09320 [Streptosporangiaceae bacterium]
MAGRGAAALRAAAQVVLVVLDDQPLDVGSVGIGERSGGSG